MSQSLSCIKKKNVLQKKVVVSFLIDDSCFIYLFVCFYIYLFSFVKKIIVHLPQTESQAFTVGRRKANNLSREIKIL